MSTSTGNIDRYPGFKAFEKNQTNLFKGRDREIQELFSLVIAENCVVLFAKSGLGKSSLLNAGISPLLERKGYIPVDVRLQVTGEQKTPLTLLKASLQQFAGKITMESIIDTDPEKIFLWEYIKSCDFPLGFTPVLIFDQFEEFFSNKADLQLVFLKQLAEILHHEPPVRILDWYKNVAIDKRTPEQIKWCSQPRVKILIGIREDRFGELNSLCLIIPNILRCPYKLNPLGLDKAREAIEIPASFNDNQYATQPFRYDKDALNAIINKLSEGKSYVESTQLQIVCHQIEKKVKEVEKDLSGDQEVVVTEDFFDGKAGLTDMIRNFYNRQIEYFAAGLQRENIKDLIEIFMVQNGRRVLLYEDQVVDFLITNHHNLKTTINPNGCQHSDGEVLDRDAALRMIMNLLELRLIRGDDREGEKLYEISHDTLINPIGAAILERKNKTEKDRLDQEKEKIKKERAEQKAWLRAEKKRADEQRKLREQADEARAKTERALKSAKAATEKAKAAAEKEKIATKKAMAATIIAQQAQQEANQARIKARILSISIFILGLAGLISSVYFFVTVKKQKKENLNLLCNTLVGQADDELDNFRNYSAFDHLYQADLLCSDAATTSFYNRLKDEILTGKDIQAYANGNRLAVQGQDSTFFIWDISRYPIRLIKSFKGVTQYQMNTLGNKILVKKNNGYITVWDLDRNDSMKGISNVKLNYVSNAKFSENGQTLAVYDQNKNLRIYKTKSDSLFLYKNNMLYKLFEKERKLFQNNFEALLRIEFTPDGQHFIFKSSFIHEGGDIYSFSLGEEKSFTRLIKNIKLLFYYDTDVLHGNNLIYITADKTNYVFTIPSNTIVKSDILTGIYQKYHRNKGLYFFMRPSNSPDIACVNEYQSNAFDDNIKTTLFNIKTGKVLTSFMRKEDPFFKVRLTLNKFTYSYLDTAGEIVFQKYTDTASFFRLDSNYYNKWNIPIGFISPNEKLLVYFRNDSLCIRDIDADSVIRRIYAPTTYSINSVNNNYFTINSRDNRNSTKLTPYYLFTKEQLRRVYPDSTARVRRQYNLKK